MNIFFLFIAIFSWILSKPELQAFVISGFIIGIPVSSYCRVNYNDYYIEFDTIESIINNAGYDISETVKSLLKEVINSKKYVQALFL